jgi:hypothetical protein
MAPPKPFSVESVASEDWKREGLVLALGNLMAYRRLRLKAINGCAKCCTHDRVHKCA